MLYLKPGDKYIHFTKYGGVNKGEVELIGGSLVHDPENEVVYDSRYIKSTVGFLLYLDGSDGRVYRITEDMDKEYFEKMKRISQFAKEIKRIRSEHKAKSRLS